VKTTESIKSNNPILKAINAFLLSSISFIPLVEKYKTTLYELEKIKTISTKIYKIDIVKTY